MVRLAIARDVLSHAFLVVHLLTDERSGPLTKGPKVITGAALK